MIKELTIKNFRSIRAASLELGRFTVLNGANNSGKSSVLYALQVLKNVVTNPNRSVDELLNLGFLNLGGFENSIFQNSKEAHIDISGVFHGVSQGLFDEKEIITEFGVNLSDKEGRSGSTLNIFGTKPHDFTGHLRLSFPHNLAKKTHARYRDPKDEDGYSETFSWDGYRADFGVGWEKEWGKTSEIQDQVNLPVEVINASDIVPTLRGFTKPIFNQVPMNGTIYTEEEVATHLAIDKTLQAKVAHYFEKITGKQFSVSMGPGGGFFYLQVREPDTPFTTELVNQGMGVNQILFLLAKILYDKNRLICIDEPEIHLHPTLIEQFVKVLVEIAEKEDKQFIFSTHSEHWLMSMLAEVNDGNLKAEDLKVYYLTKEGRETKVENQQVYPNGQIEGGLKNFLEAQMRLTNRFFTAETA